MPVPTRMLYSPAMARRLLFLVLLLSGPCVFGQKATTTDTIEARFWSGKPTLDARPDKPLWRKARPVIFQHDVNGDPLVNHLTVVRAAWTADELWLLYACSYDTLTIGPDPQTSKETNRLWEVSDVAEVFIAPNPGDILRYKEFQVSPAGQWVDLEIDREAKKYDATWNSGFRSATRIDSARRVWWAEMAIPLRAFGPQPPTPGARWRLNFFRLEQGPPKRSIVWQPTHQPSFHVPQAFGWLAFKK